MPAMTELGRSEPVSGSASPAHHHATAGVPFQREADAEDGGATFAQAIAHNIAISMAQWVQSQTASEDGVGGRDRQMVEAVAAAASAAAAAAASAVIAAAGESVQAKIHERGSAPFLVKPFTDLVPPLLRGPVNPLAYQQQLNLLSCEAAAPCMLPGFFQPQQQQGRQHNDTMMSLDLGDMWNSSAMVPPGLLAGINGPPALSGIPLTPQWMTADHPFNQVAAANARNMDRLASYNHLEEAVETRDRDGKDTETGTGTGTGTGTRTRGTGNSKTEEPAVHFVNAALRDCSQPGGVGGEGSAAGNDANKPAGVGAVEHHRQRHHSGNSNPPPPGAAQLGTSVASNQMGRKRRLDGASGGGCARQKSQNTEVPMMSDSDHARIQDFINDGNYFHQQRSAALLGGSGGGGGGGGGVGTGSGGDSGQQPGDQHEETPVKESTSGQDQEGQNRHQQQVNGSGTASGSQKNMPPPSGVRESSGCCAFNHA